MISSRRAEMHPSRQRSGRLSDVNPEGAARGCESACKTLVPNRPFRLRNAETPGSESNEVPGVDRRRERKLFR